jgi:hypothetical protein
MSDRRTPDLAELPHRIRDWWRSLPQHWNEWREGLREDPTLFWRTPLIKISFICIGTVLFFVAVDALIAGLAPPSTGSGTTEATPTATLYVICTNSDCRHRFSVTKPMDFDAWPITCTKCGQNTVYRATRCTVCGHWRAKDHGNCPFCTGQATPTPAEKPDPDPRRPRTDDDEDPW